MGYTSPVAGTGICKQERLKEVWHAQRPKLRGILLIIGCSFMSICSTHPLSSGMLEWVSMPSPRGSLQPRDQTLVSCVSCISRRVLHCWTTAEALFRNRLDKRWHLQLQMHHIFLLFLMGSTQNKIYPNYLSIRQKPITYYIQVCPYVKS